MTSATDNRTTELLPCPFCGGEPDEYEGDYGNGVYCMHCGAMVGEPIHNEWHVDGRVSYEQAVEAWNTRAPVEYDGWFYLPKPKEGFVRYGDPSIVESGDGYMKVRATVDVIESAASAWEDQLGDYVMKRICEVFNPVETCILEGSYSQEGWLDEREPIWTFDFSCGHSFTSLDNEPPAHCPDCGRKVVTP